MSPVNVNAPSRDTLRPVREGALDNRNRRDILDLVDGPRRLPGLAAKPNLPVEPPPGLPVGSVAVEDWRIQYLQLLLASPMPTGKVARRMVGTEITVATRYFELYRNQSPYPQAVVIAAQFAGGIGAQVYLSLTGDMSHEAVVDYLGETPLPPSFNKRISNAVILRPKDALFIAAVDGLKLPGATDYFRVRVWAPIEFLNSDTFPVR